jgi:zinc/manganese transport system substrate-binding protein
MQKCIAAFMSGLLLLLLCAACGTSNSSSGSQSSSTNGNVVNVVAAENFWGSIAAQVGGSHVHVTSLVTNPDADPHSYEPTSTDARTVSDAQYVIANGAGYDPWMDNLLQGNPVSGRKELNVGNFIGKKAGDNPHMWYNPTYVTAVANKMRDDLKALDPTDASYFDQSDKTFLTTDLQQYHQLISDIKTTYAGTKVGASESIFSYLAPALGLNLITPYSYLSAVSEGEDISAADEATVEQQIKDHSIKIFVYNSQNTPNNIQALITLAKANKIPIATITETLTPANVSFEQWQSSELQGIKNALAQANAAK